MTSSHLGRRWSPVRLELLLLWALLSTEAWAGVPLGGTLYVKVKNTRLAKSPKPGAEVLALLQPGTEVVWRGQDPVDKRWHRVDVGPKRGVVFQSNLSTAKPAAEVHRSSGAAPVPAQVFASSGAATKALSDGAIKYAAAKNIKDGPRQLLAIEHLALQITDAEIAARNEKVGLFVVVEPSKGGK